MKNQKGFSLVELLVVVIIIAIIAAIAIPSLLASRRAANEASAISALRSMHSAQLTYYSTNGGNTDYATQAELGPGAGNASLIDSALAGAIAVGSAKSGYYYAVTLDAADDNYCTTATPASASQGTRVFAVSTPGVIYGSTSAVPTANVPSCNAGALTINGAAVIQ